MPGQYKRLTIIRIIAVSLTSSFADLRFTDYTQHKRRLVFFFIKVYMYMHIYHIHISHALQVHVCIHVKYCWGAWSMEQHGSLMGYGVAIPLPQQATGYACTRMYMYIAKAPTCLRYCQRYVSILLQHITKC